MVRRMLGASGHPVAETSLAAVSTFSGAAVIPTSVSGQLRRFGGLSAAAGALVRYCVSLYRFAGIESNNEQEPESYENRRRLSQPGQG